MGVKLDGWGSSLRAAAAAIMPINSIARGFIFTSITSRLLSALRFGYNLIARSPLTVREIYGTEDRR